MEREILTDGLCEQFNADRLRVYVYQTCTQAGAAAGAAIAAEMRRLIAERRRAIGLFAAAPSQTEMLAALVAAPGVDWTSVISFQVDEYLGLDEAAPQSLRRYLLDHLVMRVPVAEFHGLRGEAANPSAVVANYAKLLSFKPPDFAALGIGEHGQLASIDSSVCDFHDAARVSVLALAERYRQQQVNDGCFPALADVPRRALSLTIPTLLSCTALFVTALGARKQIAVGQTLYGPVTNACPASVLRTHDNAHLFLDRAASGSRRAVGK